MAGIATSQAAVMGAIGTTARTMDELAAQLPMSRKAIAMAAGKLIQRRFLERLETGVYQLTEEGKAALGEPLTSAPHRGRRALRTVPDSLRQRAWNAMRLNAARFSVPDLVTLAATAQDGKPEDNLRRFCNQLAKAGYLQLLPARARASAPTSNGHRQWRLARDTGAKAPRFVGKQAAFFDGNSRVWFPIETGEAGDE